uniref:Immune mapped protein 2 N-terminal domain-containing protein n=1 Tax=Coccolithus braarudii TaxID=221442 RepID=A0A7S0LEU2_9EUKA|mmetsp:Transcript_31541/g.67836  ORF Transcript_31541/g.67836 Transcript_31541/m.67836 type:complete len:234 (+) Transcript_31541:65-766(+)
MKRLRRLSVGGRSRGPTKTEEPGMISEEVAAAAVEAERIMAAEKEVAEKLAAEAAAAEAERIEREKTIGCYLTFSDACQGSLSTVWSTEPVEGAIAFFKSQKPVAQHKFTANQGRSVLVSQCGGLKSSAGQSSKKFFKGIAQFIKSAKTWEGTIDFIAQLEGRPVSIFLNDAEINVVPVVFGSHVEAATLARMKAVAVFSEAAGQQHMNVLKLETNYFMSIAEKEGAGLVLSA